MSAGWLVDHHSPFRLYNIVRGAEVIAFAVTLPSGKCVVSWPTSTIVYDSEEAARDVHIKHMGGRGEPTEFSLVHDEERRVQGAISAIQDSAENAPFNCVGGVDKRQAMEVPAWVTDEMLPHWLGGYLGQCAAMYGRGWQTCGFGWAPALTVSKPSCGGCGQVECQHCQAEIDRAMGVRDEEPA